jgi:hypothetical protein
MSARTNFLQQDEGASLGSASPILGNILKTAVARGALQRRGDRGAVSALVEW